MYATTRPMTLTAAKVDNRIKAQNLWDQDLSIYSTKTTTTFEGSNKPLIDLAPPSLLSYWMFRSYHISFINVLPICSPYSNTTSGKFQKIYKINTSNATPRGEGKNVSLTSAEPKTFEINLWATTKQRNCNTSWLMRNEK